MFTSLSKKLMYHQKRAETSIKIIINCTFLNTNEMDGRMRFICLENCMRWCNNSIEVSFLKQKEKSDSHNAVNKIKVGT